MARIVVTPADEDEVIVVGETNDDRKGAESFGSRSPEDAHDPAVHNPADRGYALRDGANDADGAVGVSTVAVAQGTESETGGSNAPTASTDSRSTSSTRKRTTPAPDAYREATLEDLEPSPMPFAQKVVIVAAVVCIIGALVYYFVVMR